jgi:hypothetical protein
VLMWENVLALDSPHLPDKDICCGELTPWKQLASPSVRFYPTSENTTGWCCFCLSGFAAVVHSAPNVT